MGCNVLECNTSGNSNIFIGEDAGRFNTSGCENLGIGCMALWCNTEGSYNLALGRNALGSNTGGTQNIAIGYTALGGNVDGNHNIAIGCEALSNGSSVYQNVAIGRIVLSNSCGCFNTAIGDGALNGDACGCFNTAIGATASAGNVSGCCNTAIGNRALALNEYGCTNVAIGNSAGYFETGSSKLYVSNSDTVNPLIYGDFSTSCVKINGQLQITGVTDGSVSDSMLLWNSSDKTVKKLPYPGGGGDKNNIYSMTTVGSGTTQLTTGDTYVILVNHTGGPATIILPSGVTITQGLAFKIKDASYNANTYNITINSASPTRYIDDGVSTTAVINTNGGAYELAYDQGLNMWFTLGMVN